MMRTIKPTGYAAFKYVFCSTDTFVEVITIQQNNHNVETFF